MTLTGGGVFSGDTDDPATGADVASSQFGGYDRYLAVEARPRIDLLEPETPCGLGKVQWLGKCHLMFEVQVGAMLTSLPVVGQTSEAPTAGNGETDANGTSPDSSTGPPSPSSSSDGIPYPDSSLLSQQKVAQLQFGFYVEALSIRPKEKNAGWYWGTGLTGMWSADSVTDEQKVRRPWNPTDDLYDSNGFGVRATLYQKDEGNWRPAAYVAAYAASFQSFEIPTGLTERARNCLERAEACDPAPGADEFETDRRRRAYVEGRLLLRSLYLGFNLNNGQGRDDLRFFAGFTISLSDLSSLFLGPAGATP